MWKQITCRSNQIFSIQGFRLRSGIYGLKQKVSLEIVRERVMILRSSSGKRATCSITSPNVMRIRSSSYKFWLSSDRELVSKH